MSLFTLLHELILGPLELLFDVVYAIMYRITDNAGLSIIALSLVINFMVLPLYRRADAMQEEERVRTQKLGPGVDHIKKVFKGDERFMMLQTYYRQNNYKPYYALNGSLSLLLEIPFFIAAYQYLSNLRLLRGVSFGPISDLYLPDGLLHIAGYSLNLLPILMTAINLISGMIYTKGMPLKNKMQLYGMALIFLVFLYQSPSGLVFYWTLNNLFSLIKNLFYKIRNSKLILSIISAVVAIVLMPYLIFIHPMSTMRKQIILIVALLLMLLPLPAYVYLKKHTVKITVPEATKTDNIIFYACCLFMTLLVGVLIPSAVMNASPTEFVNIADFHSPLRYVVSSCVLAAGTFLVWVNIFYRLATASVRKGISLVSVIVSASSVVNYMFFGKQYGNMSAMLKYDDVLCPSHAQYIVNSVVLLGVMVGIILLWKLRPAFVQSVCAAGCAAVLVMSCVNIVSIQSNITSLRNALAKSSQQQEIRLPLSKTGKNVVVLMMDRAIGKFIPFIMQEKPELQKQFAGFTYYSNTISYGNYTNVGSPGLFGGYEYIPEENMKDSDRLLEEKQNEALKVMPVVFLENGYDVTVCDPPYAGYQWIPDLSIYNDYPEIHKYITKGSFSNEYKANRTDELRNRNLFAYGVFRSSPVICHPSLYNDGLYNQADQMMDSYGQVVTGMYNAKGGLLDVYSGFIMSYDAIRSYSEITDIRDDGQDNFIMMSNDMTHDLMMLQEPAYEPSFIVDNSEYESEHFVRHSLDGSEMVFTDSNQIMHYQCNVAAMLQLGKWMDFLREKGVYDNTRIIIVSDHGRNLNYLLNMQFSDRGEKFTRSEDDAMYYDALLLVKDFNSQEFTIDNTFMTNADTPTLAFSGMIDHPVNPFTGNQITSDGKNVPEHHIAHTRASNIFENRGNTFKDITWIGLKGDDSSDMSAWRVIGRNLE